MAATGGVVAGLREFKVDVVVGEIRRRKGLGEDEAREALGEWVARHRGSFRTEMFGSLRSPGSMFRPAAHELILVVPDDELPDD